MSHAAAAARGGGGLFAAKLITVKKVLA